MNFDYYISANADFVLLDETTFINIIKVCKYVSCQVAHFVEFDGESKEYIIIYSKKACIYIGLHVKHKRFVERRA